MKRIIAAIGDPHGCIEELEELYSHLQWCSIDEIWSLGDNVDRGPDSGAVVQFLRENNIKSIRGNHDDVICSLYPRYKKNPDMKLRNEDKKRTLSQLTDADFEYLDTCPKIHVFDDIKLILVHGGLWPKIPLYAQPVNVIRAQMIHPDVIRNGENRWWGKDATLSSKGTTEEENYKEGFRRWYELYDYEYDCAYGHSVFTQPKIHQNPGMGKTVGLDTGSCFGGSVTAGIFGRSDRPFFISVKSKKVYFALTRRLIPE